MSAMVGTSRAGRPSKDKNAKSTSAPASQTLTSAKTDRSAAKHQPQATVEQMRMAAMIDSGKDSANIATVKQLVEMTGRTEDDVVVALHDAQDDPDKAVLLLLEGGQGEWEEQGKKKKRSNTVKDKEAPVSIPENEAGDSRPDRSRDRRDHDRHDVPPRRGRDRRNGGPPPRLARGRGRDRNFGGSGGGNRDRDRSNFNGEQEREENWDAELVDTGDRRPERGQFGERGRGRGRGGFGRPSTRGGRPRRFDRPNESSDGPQIDTWTNETAENAEKENNSWGETWGETNEDWNEDTWTGSLDESKVFTPSQTNSMVESDLTSALNDTTNTIGQRLDVGSLFSKSAEFPKAPDFTKTNESAGDSFFSQYNQQATESIKNSIGIGSSPRQNLSSIPASQPQQQPQPLGSLGSMPQRDMGQNVRGSLASSVPHPMMPQSTSSSLQQPSSQQQVQRRPQRSKLPPPSKIPQSAVEMPGHMMPQLDVQFGVDFGSDSSQFGFGSSGGGGDSNTFPSATSSGSSGLTNHLGQNKTAVDSSRQSSVMSSPSAGSKPPQGSSLPPMDGSPSRPTVFPNSVYTTPTKSDAQSLGQSANKVTPEPIPFPSPSDHKSSGLVNSQRTAQSPASLSQGSLSTSKPDTSTLPSFSAANGYASSSYSAHAGHKSAGHSSSSTPQNYPHTAVTSQATVSNYQNQYTSQNQYPGAQVAHGSQSQFPSAGQTQYPGNQPQYHGTASAGSGTGQTQFMPSQAQYQSGQGPFPAPPVTQTQYQSGSQYGGYQSGSSSFQNQTGMSSVASSQSAQSSLYPASTQQSGSSYPTGSSSFHVRDSQSASSLQGSGGSQSSNSYQTQPAPGLKAVTTQQSVSSYSSQSYSGSHSGQGSQHPQNLQPSQLANKLGDSISKMSLKDGSLDTRSSSQYDHGSASTSSATLTTTTSSSISSVTSTVSATSTPVATSSTLNSRASATLPMTTKAPPNLPPGVPLLNPQYIMGQAGTLPPFYGLQQPVFGYEDMQMLQQRLPTLQTGTGYYDMSAFPGVPSTIAGRDQAAALGTAPFTGTGTDNKPLNRVEAQSPNASNQQQSTHNAPQQTMPFNIHYGYYYPGAVLPGAASFQYPTMFPVPPVTNAPAPHVPGTTTTTQLPKTYGSHQGYVSKGYEEVGSQDLNKAGYAGLQQPTKVAGGSRTGTTADINTAAYTKSHTQGFDKQGFPGGTPPPFSLPLASASQAGPLGAPAAPYGAPFLPMMPPQPHNQTILHHPLQQDSGAGSARGLQQPSNQAKTGGGKPYGNYWGN